MALSAYKHASVDALQHAKGVKKTSDLDLQV